MDLRLYLDSIEVNSSSLEGTMRDAIQTDFILKPGDVVLLSVMEGGEWRDSFYNLKRGEKTYSIIDLGNLRPGETVEETNHRLTEVLAYLMMKGVTPVVIGGSQAFAYGQYLSFREDGKPIKMANIDGVIDIEDTELTEHSVIRKVITEQPGHLKGFAQLGYQQFLNTPSVVNLFEKLAFEKFRLGELRHGLEDAEPSLRMSDLISFDINCIKQSEFTSKTDQNPFGFTAEEVAQLCWYAGLSDQLKSFSIFNIPKELNEASANVLAVMIWYFIEGVYHRVDDLKFDSESYLSFNVLVEGHEGICFYKNRLSGKWWLKAASGDVVPCAHSDYECATKGEVPLRWMSS